MNDNDIKSAESIAQRKEFLRAQGAVYRLQLLDAKIGVSANLRPATMVQNTLGRIASLGVAAFSGGGKFGGLSSMLPLVVSGVIAVSRRVAIKPLLGGALVLGAVAGVVSVVNKRRKARKLKRLQAEIYPG